MNLGDKRTQQANDLRAIIGHDELVLPNKVELDPNFEREDRFDNEYGRLAERLYGGLAVMAAASGNERMTGLVSHGNVLNGMYVLTSMLSYGPKAYGAYLQDHPTPEHPVAELGKIMKRSDGTARLFADIDGYSNASFELNFGLWQHPPVYERCLL